MEKSLIKQILLWDFQEVFFLISRHYCAHQIRDFFHCFNDCDTKLFSYFEPALVADKIIRFGESYHRTAVHRGKVVVKWNTQTQQGV